MLLHNLYINMALAHILLYGKSLYDLQVPSYWFPEIALIADEKISFSRFSRKLTVLDHMLLHNSYINVTIAHILVYRKCLYDLPEPKSYFHEYTQKRAWPPWLLPKVLRLKKFFGGSRHHYESIPPLKPLVEIFSHFAQI